MTDRHSEEAIEPSLPIIDAHHHVRDRPNDSYLFDDLRNDLNAGHNIRATVAIECGDMYRAFGPPDYRPVGEAEFLAGVAAMFASGRYGPLMACAAIVGFVDLRLGSKAAPVLDALSAASGGRLRGIRNPVAWHPSEELRRTRCGPEGLLSDPQFERGVMLLGERGLSLDAWIYHPQLPDFADLARRCPHTTLVLNHVGGPLGTGPYAGRRDAVFAEWKRMLAGVAQYPNVVCKLGGLGLPIFGFDLGSAPTSIDCATAWKPYIESAIELFGVDRCMFESNFPSDRVGIGYVEMWNAFKHMSAALSSTQRHALFSGTAMRVYRLEQALRTAADPLVSGAR
jgi:L-fuconolactonase